jgi:hypothetical protein
MDPVIVLKMVDITYMDPVIVLKMVDIKYMDPVIYHRVHIFYIYIFNTITGSIYFISTFLILSHIYVFNTITGCIKNVDIKYMDPVIVLKT